jgi:excisionase family DNA binding protein
MVEVNESTTNAISADAAGTPAGGRYADRIETAAYLSICVRTLDALLKQKKIPHYRVGRRVMFDLHDVARWMQTYCKVDAG